jgi:hypothetical protein
MAKYTQSQSDIEGVFATSAWTTNGIAAFPVNFQIPSEISEFIKVEYLPLNTDISFGRCGISGFAIIQIYVPSDQGTRRLMEISDLLDILLENKSLGNGTRTGASSLNILGQDLGNPNLFRGDYRVNFTFYN